MKQGIFAVFKDAYGITVYISPSFGELGAAKT
jgi:hypothetical protein